LLAVACGGGSGGGGQASSQPSPADSSGGTLARVATTQAEQTALAKSTAAAREAMVSATAAVTAPSATLEITAKNIMFDKKVLVAPANTLVKVRLVIDETGDFAGAQHNFSVYRDSSLTEKIFAAGTETKTVEYAFTTPGPGTYFFRCDPHPGAMEGAFVVK